MDHAPPSSAAGSRPQGSTLRYVAGLLPSLVPSEARVAAAMLESDTPAREWSVAAMAHAARTSPATVIRTCQSLGFTGFNQLRDVLVREAEAPAPWTPTGGADTTMDAVRRTLAAGSAQIESMAAMLDPIQVERAVEILATARRVLIVTMSDLALLGQYALFRFAAIGRPVDAPTDAITTNALAAQLRDGDACLAIGHSGTNAFTVRIAHAAAIAGAQVIAITSFARGPLAEVADVHLAVGSVDSHQAIHEHARVRVGQMLMIDALQNALALRLDTAHASSTMHRTLSQYVHRRRGD